MLTLWGSQQKLCDRISRRQFMQVGGLGLAGLSLADLLRAQAQQGKTSNGKAVIMVWLGGGPSQLDTYDLKPDAPVEFRGEFKPIQTKVPGFDICEHLPLQAQLTDKLSVVRSLTFPEPNNHDRSLNFSGFFDPLRRPAFGSIVSKFRSAPGDRMPRYVSMVGRNSEQPFMEEPHYVGAAHKPFRIEHDEPKGLGLVRGVTAAQLEERQQLMRTFDGLRRDLDTRGDLAALDDFQARALDMIASPKAMAAFDLSKEPLQARERYGRNSSFQIGDLRMGWGAEKLLLARRLVEAGVSVVTVPLGEWDHHGPSTSGGNIFEVLRKMLPLLDRALSALITDLHERGMHQDVAVVVWGEMGRGPRINKYPGRDHWSSSAFALFSGGGLTMGQVVGATDRTGARPQTRAYGPQNVLATLYRHLGIDLAETVNDFTGRPMHLLDDCEPIAELV